MSSFYSVLTHKSVDIQEDTLIMELESHLTALLNARQYMVSTTHEYGLPDFCSEISKGYSDKLIQAAKELIAKYEPRLVIHNIECNPKVRVDTQLEIKVTGSVKEGTDVHFIARLGSHYNQSVKFI